MCPTILFLLSIHQAISITGFVGCKISRLNPCQQKFISVVSRRSYSSYARKEPSRAVTVNNSNRKKGSVTTDDVVPDAGPAWDESSIEEHFANLVVKECVKLAENTTCNGPVQLSPAPTGSAPSATKMRKCLSL